MQGPWLHSPPKLAALRHVLRGHEMLVALVASGLLWIVIAALILR